MFGKKSNKKLFAAPPLDGEKETAKKDYSFDLKLGDGAFGQVWKIRHKKTGKVYACKQVAKERVAKMIEQFKREILIMYELSHPYIIKLYHHFEDDKNFYLVMEIAEGGNLFQKLANDRFFLEQQANQYFHEVLSAVEYLHSHTPAIIHRDIKPENILIDSNGTLKLSDFGWSNYYSMEGTPRYTICGTYEYLCPEMVRESGHTPAVDIWCLGILLYEMLCGYTPFKGQSKDNVMENISKGKLKFPSSISPLAKNLLCKILEQNPGKRITIEKIKQHEWFRSLPNAKSTKTEEETKEIKKVDSNNKLKVLNKDLHLNSFRQSVSNLKNELNEKIEACKEIKEKIKNLTTLAKDEEANIKVIEHEIAEKRKEVLEFVENNKALNEKLMDSNILLEKLGTTSSIASIQENIKEKSREISLKSAEVQKKMSEITDFYTKLQSIDSELTDKTRYLANLKQHLTKLKSKKAILHKTKQSELSDLQSSYDFLQNQIFEREKQFELLETPENKVLRDLMLYVKSNKDKLIESTYIEENLKIIDDELVLKEVDLERIKIEYLDRKKNFIKAARLEKDQIAKKNIEKRILEEKISQALSLTKILEEELMISRTLEKKYRFECFDIDSAKEKVKVTGIQALKIKLSTVNSRVSKSKIDQTKIKSAINQRSNSIASIEMELGLIKSTILSIENVS